MSTHEHPTAPPRISYSPREFAAATSLSLSTVRRRIATGELEAVRCGRRQLIPASEFERLSRRHLAAQLEQTERFSRRLESVSRALADVRKRVTPESLDDPADVALLDRLEREIAHLASDVTALERLVRPQEQAA